MAQWLRGGSIYDVTAGAYRRGDVRIEAGRIASISDGAKPAGDDQVIDVEGAYLLPGLIDCHVHLCMPTESADPDNPWRGKLPGDIAIYAAEAAKRTLMAGVTTARDVGGWDYHEIAVRNAINRGEIPGPRLFCAGRLLSITTATTSFYPGMYETADGPEQVRAAARKQLANGADLIKVMATGAMTSSEYEDSRAIQFTLEELKVAVEIAEDNYKHCAAHAHATDGIKNAALAGCRSVEHGTFGNEEVYGVMAEKGTYLVPTTCVTSAMLADNAVAASLTPHIKERYIATDDIHLKNMDLAKRLGVPVAMGTDAGTPGNHHGDNAQELVRMVEGAGFTPQEAVYSATLGAATMLRREDDLGSIDEGKFADIIGFADDPLSDINVTRDVRMVMKGGDVVRYDR